MSKKNKEKGTCALCKAKNVELRDSHIIPRLTYNRTKTYKESQFRNIYDIKTIYRDGEKKPMLCQSCETFFSRMETGFTNKYLDKYIETNKLPKKKDKVYDYIVSVAWRVLYDDIYNLKSFNGQTTYSFYRDFENELYCYLDGVRNKIESKRPKRIKNYVYSLTDLHYSEQVIDLLKSMIAGYSYNYDLSKFLVITLYNGLVIVTVYYPEILMLDRSLFDFIIDRYSDKYVKQWVVQEINTMLSEVNNQNKINDAILNSGLREKIRKRYENKNKIRQYIGHPLGGFLLPIFRRWSIWK